MNDGFTLVDSAALIALFFVVLIVTVLIVIIEIDSKLRDYLFSLGKMLCTYLSMYTSFEKTGLAIRQIVSNTMDILPPKMSIFRFVVLDS